MSLSTTVLNDLKTRIGEVWPDVGTRIYEAQRANQIAWKSHQTPYAVIVMPSPQRTDEYSVDTIAYIARPSIYYVTSINGVMDILRDHAEGMMLSLMDTDLESAQVTDVPAWGWDEDVEPNTLFAGEGLTFRACQVDAEILLLP